MQGSTRCICSFTHHLNQQMISCDKCGKWQHAYCMGITQAKFAEFEKRKGMIVKSIVDTRSSKWL